MEFDMAVSHSVGLSPGSSEGLGGHVRTLVLIGPSGMGLPGVPGTPLLKIHPEMAREGPLREHRSSVPAGLLLMIVHPKRHKRQYGLYYSMERWLVELLS